MRLLDIRRAEGIRNGGRWGDSALLDHCTVVEPLSLKDRTVLRLGLLEDRTVVRPCLFEDCTVVEPPSVRGPHCSGALHFQKCRTVVGPFMYCRSTLDRPQDRNLSKRVRWLGNIYLSEGLGIRRKTDGVMECCHWGWCSQE